jgi:hypothetical protein
MESSENVIDFIYRIVNEELVSLYGQRTIQSLSHEERNNLIGAAAHRLSQHTETVV